MRGRLTVGLLLLEALVAIEIMVVATILPAVEADLHGLSSYGWVFVSLTLASFVTVPIAGRMIDRVDPRPVLGVSIAFYIVGLVLAAEALGITRQAVYNKLRSIERASHEEHIVIPGREEPRER